MDDQPTKIDDPLYCKHENSTMRYIAEGPNILGQHVECVMEKLQCLKCGEVAYIKRVSEDYV